MAYPKWFNEVEYLNAKLAQLQRLEVKDPSGNAYLSITQVAEAIKAGGMTPFDHYNKFGSVENLAPSTAFNVPEYCAFKLRQLQTTDATKAEWAGKTWQDVEYFINKAGMSVGQHYAQYGALEGVSMNNSFDTNAYLTAKLNLLKGAEATKTEWANKTVTDLASFLKAAGTDPYTHYMTFKGATGEVKATDTFKPVKPVDPNAGGAGKVFTLTTGADTFTGDTGNDIFRGFNADNKVASNTLNSTDILDGKAGMDTLNATLANESGNAIAITPMLTSIEVLNLTVAAATNAVALDLSSSSGYQEVWSKWDGTNAQKNLTVDKVNLNASIGMEGNHTGATFTAKFAGVTGSSDSANLILKNATGTGAVDVDGIEILNISSTGGANKLTVNSDAIETIKVTGDKALGLTIGATTDGANTIHTIDAGALTGNFSLATLANAEDVTIIGSTGKNVIAVAGTSKAAITTHDAADSITLGGAGVATVKAGGGTDEITVSAAGKHVITTGDGADTVYFNGGSAVATSNLAAMTTIMDFKVAGADKIDLSALTGVAFAAASKQTGAQDAIDALPTTATIDDALAAAAGVTAQDDLVAFTFKGNTYIYAEQGTSGLAAADLVIKLNGVVDVVAADFAFA